MSGWNPSHYLTFSDERTRAARDLLAQVPLSTARRVYDLGCGPGNSTALLVERFAGAAITGIDNSVAMLEAARKACPSVAFEAGDLAQWAPPDVPDLLFSNAALQWVPDHLGVMERLVRRLPKGGVLAVQMPDNLAKPSHALMQRVAEEGPWAEKLKRAAGAREAMPAVEGYYARLKRHLTKLDIWHTIYNHSLDGVDGIIAWLMATGLRPYLDPLAPDERAHYLARYRALLAETYPLQADGKVLLPFPRLFIIGLR